MPMPMTYTINNGIKSYSQCVLSYCNNRPMTMTDDIRVTCVTVTMIPQYAMWRRWLWGHLSSSLVYCLFHQCIVH